MELRRNNRVEVAKDFVLGLVKKSSTSHRITIWWEEDEQDHQLMLVERVEREKTLRFNAFPEKAFELIEGLLTLGHLVVVEIDGKTVLTASR